jgi:NAD(P)H-hydrate epimerase
MTDAFFTEAGTRLPAVTADQMREIDRVAIEEVGPNLHQMMENAGRSLALAAMDMLGPRWISVPITVLAGTGGNGGGGICAARHLANRGADVTVLITDPEDLSPVPGDQFALYRATSGKLAAPEDLANLDAALVIDAVIGYGLGGPPRDAALKMIEWAGTRSSKVLSLDVPSGVDSTTGAAPGAHVRATATMTLALPKTGLGAPAVGDLWLADIGIPSEVFRRVGIEVPVGMFADRYLIPLRPA